MPRHCPSCNRSEADAKFYGEFCEFCSRDRLKERLPTHADITLCRRCQRVWNGQRFVEPEGRGLEQALGLKLKGYTLHLLKVNQSTMLVELGEERREGLLTVEKEIDITYEKKLCEECKRILGDYYEAKIQLRGDPAKIQKMRERIIRYIKKSRATITKEAEEDEGVDLFVSSKVVVAEMLTHMRLKPVVSYTLYGEKRGRRIYRNTYAVRL